MNTHFIILLLALAGLADSLYLNYERKKKRPPVCIIGEGCKTVWTSKYRRTFGLSNEILGIIYYSTFAVIEWTLFSGGISSPMIIGEYMFLVGGAAASLYFIYLEWRIIRAWCFWCTLSAVIVWSMIAIKMLF